MDNTWHDILDEVARLKAEITEPGYATIWYRGHSNAQWKCLSTLHRRVEEFMARCSLTGDEQWKIGLLKTVNHTLYHKFVARASHLLEPLERSKWGVVFSMRHQGFLTRLLDWSESFACALHFAQSDRQADQDTAIYLLNPQFLNEITCGRRGLIALHSVESGPSNLDPDLWHPAFDTDTSLPTIAVAPIFTNRRMIAQHCAFTISGDSFQSLEAQYPTCVRKLLEGLRREFTEMLEREVQDMLRYQAEGKIKST